MREHADWHRYLFVVSGLLLPAVAIAVAWPAVAAVAVVLTGTWDAAPPPQRTALVTGTTVAALLVLLGHVLRAARTKVVLDSVRRGTLKGQFQALAVAYAFGLALPLRLGELARAYIVSRKLRISLLYTLVAIALERIIDVVLVGVAFLVVAGPLLGGASAAAVVAAVLATVVALALLVLFVQLVREERWLMRLAWRSTGWLNPRLESRARFTVWSVIFGFQRFLTQRNRVVWYALLTALSWASYVSATLVLAVAVLDGGPAADAAAAAAPYAVASPALGTSLPTPLVSGVSGVLTQALPGEGVRVALFAAASWVVLTVPVVVVGWASLLLLVRPWRRPAPQEPLRGSYVNKLERDEDISGALPSFLDAYFGQGRLAHVLHDLEVRGHVTLLRFFKGGSNAVTVLASQGEEVYVKKLVPTEHAHRLAHQHDWLAARRDMPELVTVLREERGDDHYAIDLEYRPDSVPLQQYVHTQPLALSVARLEEVWCWITTSIYRLHPATAHPAERDAYVEERFVRRVRAAGAELADLAEVLAADRVVVNGVELDGFDAVLARIRAHPQAWGELAAYQTSDAIHGDLTVDNILVDMAVGEHGSALVIDPSDDNEVRGPVIDFARHLQSLRYGYEFLNDDEDAVPLRRRADGVPWIAYADRRTARYAELDEYVTTHVMPRYLTGAEQRTVLFHVGLFYGRMLTHRVVINPGTALKYLAVSLHALSSFIDQYDFPDQQETP